MAIWERLRQGLSRTREGFLAPLEAMVKERGGLDAEALEEIEDLLIAADVGPEAAGELVARLRAGLDKGAVSWDQVQAALEEEVAELLAGAEVDWTPPEARPGVLLFVGVNGSGKTTTCAKVGWMLKRQGLRVLFAAADTFRAAAIDQLTQLGDELGVEVIAHRPGADPGAVVHDALAHAGSKGYDCVLVDTAGRLQTKRPLMEELGKVRRVVEKLAGRPPDERILVVDATVGQNAISQAELFHEAVELTGLAITKLDGSAKGGAVIPIWRALEIPILWIGLGKGLADIAPFRAREFAQALLRR
ncbi:TPA: signal recognition particle-docking protein FtsY [Candidatus Bipolaricaulota bacterium]|nr:signal recognition particle-docking protein FtsY [Candidatus Bipolaricaulota bacterium]